MPRSKARTRRLRRSFVIALGLIAAEVPQLAHAEPANLEARSAATPAQSQVEDSGPPLLAYAVGAVGLSALSVAAVTGFLAMNQQGVVEDHCSPALRLCDGLGRQANETGRTLRDISTVAAIVGGVGIGLSAYLILSEPTRQSQVALSFSVDGASPKAALVANF